ncbi:MAG: glycoside hydrolase family 5 protein, partial [Candidatus Bathyarchaeia archaeon]
MKELKIYWIYFRRMKKSGLKIFILFPVLIVVLCFVVLGNAYCGQLPANGHYMEPTLKMKRGINIGNALEAPKEGMWGVYIKDEYLSIIREAGFDTVRIPIKWSAHAEEEPPYKIDEDFFSRVDHVVSKALEQNLIVVLNIHHYDEIMQDPRGHKDRFLALWRQISEHYKNYPENLYFELLNEPHDSLTSELWNEFLLDVIRIIRETNPIRKIVVGPSNWNNV